MFKTTLHLNQSKSCSYILHRIINFFIFDLNSGITSSNPLLSYNEVCLQRKDLHVCCALNILKVFYDFVNVYCSKTGFCVWDIYRLRKTYLENNFNMFFIFSPAMLPLIPSNLVSLQGERGTMSKLLLSILFTAEILTNLELL